MHLRHTFTTLRLATYNYPAKKHMHFFDRNRKLVIVYLSMHYDHMKRLYNDGIVHLRHTFTTLRLATYIYPREKAYALF